MNAVLLVAALVGLVIATAFGFLFRRLVAQGKSLPVTSDWLDNLSMARYRPMERLLDEGDLRFLASQPGMSPKAIRKLRAERRRMFHGYLRCLAADFNRICTAIRLIMLQSSQDRPDLAVVLFKQRWAFTWALMGVECRLALQACGLGTVDVRNLVGVLDAMKLEFNQLATATSQAAA